MEGPRLYTIDGMGWDGIGWDGMEEEKKNGNKSHLQPLNPYHPIHRMNVPSVWGEGGVGRRGAVRSIGGGRGTLHARM